MPKRKTIATLVNEAATLLQKKVRIKAADDSGMCQCVTCKKWGHWKEMQGGHFISRRYTAHKLLEENIHPQCRGCNGPLMGNLTNYTLYMVDHYGRDFVDHLESTKGETKKYSRAEITEIIEELKTEVKELERSAA